ncbi:MAG: thiamine diphosphokinase [Clostridia bacterium]|nr:thiamine diphosphokinase [Clostridia bacterium]
MKTIIFLGGEEYKGIPQIDEGDKIICCDGAYNYLLERRIKPDVVMGDFDSLGFVPEGAIVYPVEKDMTDFEIAVEYLIENELKDAVVYCGGGGREDHLLANYAVALKAFKKGINLRFITNYTTAFFVSGNCRFVVKRGSVISLVAFNKAKIDFSEGLKYAYREVVLEFNTSLGVSNVATADEVKLSFEYGEALVLIVDAELHHCGEL